MIIQVGQVSAPDPEGNVVKFRVIQALDPLFQLPVAQIAIPIGEQSVMIGNAIAGNADDPTKLIVPDFIPPDDLTPGR